MPTTWAVQVDRTGSPTGPGQSSPVWIPNDHNDPLRPNGVPMTPWFNTILVWLVPVLGGGVTGGGVCEPARSSITVIWPAQGANNFALCFGPIDTLPAESGSSPMKICHARTIASIAASQSSESSRLVCGGNDVLFSARLASRTLSLSACPVCSLLR